ncbi:unnamed protein product, partial [Prorocentrum cordatum]
RCPRVAAGAVAGDAPPRQPEIGRQRAAGSKPLGFAEDFLGLGGAAGGDGPHGPPRASGRAHPQRPPARARGRPATAGGRRRGRGGRCRRGGGLGLAAERPLGGPADRPLRRRARGQGLGQRRLRPRRAVAGGHALGEAHAEQGGLPVDPRGARRPGRPRGRHGLAPAHGHRGDPARPMAYNALVAGCATASDWAKALDCFGEMRLVMLDPDADSDRRANRGPDIHCRRSPSTSRSGARGSPPRIGASGAALCRAPRASWEGSPAPLRRVRAWLRAVMPAPCFAP